MEIIILGSINKKGIIVAKKKNKKKVTSVIESRGRRIEDRPRNTIPMLRKFDYQLTYEMPLKELHSVVAQIRKVDGMNSYGKSYIVIRNNKNNKYAVYTTGELLQKDAYENVPDVTVEEDSEEINLFKSVINTKKYLRTFF